LVVNLDELNLRELLEVLYQRLGNGVKRAVRLAITNEVNMRNTIGKGKLAITCKPVIERDPAIPKPLS